MRRKNQDVSRTLFRTDNYEVSFDDYDKERPFVFACKNNGQSQYAWVGTSLSVDEVKTLFIRVLEQLDRIDKSEKKRES